MRMLPSFYFDDVVDNFFGKSVSFSNNMKCDIFEENGLYTIEIDVPGFNKEDININVDNNYLTVSASRKGESNDSTKKYVRRERNYGEYKRTFYIGTLDSSRIEAKFENGMLTIKVPKKEIDNTSKKIDIM